MRINPRCCLLVLITGLLACDKGNEDFMDVEQETVDAVETLGVKIEGLSITFEGKYSLSSPMAQDFSVGFEISETDGFETVIGRMRLQNANRQNEFAYVSTGSTRGETYYVRAYMQNQFAVFYGSVKSFKTTTEYNPTVGEAVDLGLSVKWASFNVGAQKPEDYGDYFTWGETLPGFNYSWSKYKYCKGSATTLTKYCVRSYYGYNGYTDTKTILDPEDDVSHVKWGGKWRMPTKEEFDELSNSVNCNWTWTTRNGVNGYLVTSKKSGHEGASIFLPAAGYRSFTDLNTIGGFGYYWSYSLFEGNPYLAWVFSCYNLSYSDHYFTQNFERVYGCTVRPVCP
jgi:hypothetical protein